MDFAINHAAIGVFDALAPRHHRRDDATLGTLHADLGHQLRLVVVAPAIRLIGERGQASVGVGGRLALVVVRVDAFAA